MNGRSLAAAILVLQLSLPAYCESGHERGKIAVTFKTEVTEEEAVKFIKRFKMEILRKEDFNFYSVQFVMEESALDAFIKEIEKEPIVSLATKGERLEINDREGIVVRAEFKKSADRRKIDELGLSYQKREGVIAWRYNRRGPPIMIIKVPPGQEQSYTNTFNKPEYGNIVDRAHLISL